MYHVQYGPSFVQGLRTPYYYIQNYDTEIELVRRYCIYTFTSDEILRILRSSSHAWTATDMNEFNQ